MDGYDNKTQVEQCREKTDAYSGEVEQFRGQYTYLRDPFDPA
ncbi:hypothetical protein [Marinobacterium arenosum]|nr:hypothetical protein [Marinobacterium arenosum]